MQQVNLEILLKYVTFFIQTESQTLYMYSELLWSIFSRIRTEYEETLRSSPYSVQMRENMDQNNSEHRHF